MRARYARCVEPCVMYAATRYWLLRAFVCFCLLLPMRTELTIPGLCRPATEPANRPTPMPTSERLPGGDYVQTTLTSLLWFTRYNEQSPTETPLSVSSGSACGS